MQSTTSTPPPSLNSIEVRNLSQVAYYVRHGFRLKVHHRGNRWFMVRETDRMVDLVAHGVPLVLTTPAENAALAKRQRATFQFLGTSGKALRRRGQFIERIARRQYEQVVGHPYGEPRPRTRPVAVPAAV